MHHVSGRRGGFSQARSEKLQGSFFIIISPFSFATLSHFSRNKSGQLNGPKGLSNRISLKNAKKTFENPNFLRSNFRHLYSDPISTVADDKYKKLMKDVSYTTAQVIDLERCGNRIPKRVKFSSRHLAPLPTKMNE
jgi:hypothetical protein